MFKLNTGIDNRSKTLTKAFVVKQYEVVKISIIANTQSAGPHTTAETTTIVCNHSRNGISRRHCRCHSNSLSSMKSTRWKPTGIPGPSELAACVSPVQLALLSYQPALLLRQSLFLTPVFGLPITYADGINGPLLARKTSKHVFTDNMSSKPTLPYKVPSV